jgi:ribosomal protein S18 acetylase RimI-like enzyme
MTAAGNTPLIRIARIDDAARIGELARAAYTKYVPRIGREPAPMIADYDAEIAAQRVVVVEMGDRVGGYMIAWPEVDAYFIDNIAVDPECQGYGLGRCLIEHAVAEANRLRGQGIINLDAAIPDCAFNLGMAQEDLHRS